MESPTRLVTGPYAQRTHQPSASQWKGCFVFCLATHAHSTARQQLTLQHTVLLKPLGGISLSPKSGFDGLASQGRKGQSGFYYSILFLCPTSRTSLPLSPSRLCRTDGQQPLGGKHFLCSYVFENILCNFFCFLLLFSFVKLNSFSALGSKRFQTWEHHSRRRQGKARQTGPQAGGTAAVGSGRGGGDGEIQEFYGGGLFCCATRTLLLVVVVVV